jgi:hypothetical protein
MRGKVPEAYRPHSSSASRRAASLSILSQYGDRPET